MGLLKEVCSALYPPGFEARAVAFEQRIRESASGESSAPDPLGGLAGLQAPPRKAEDPPGLE